MFGAAMADYIDRSLDIGLSGETLLLLMVLVGTLCLWYGVFGSISIETVRTPGPELSYWTAVTISQNARHGSG